MRRIYPDVCFTLAGGIDPGPDSIKQQELDVWVHEGLINYVGVSSDVRPIIANCSVMVLPSYREGVPRSILEAMAMGRAIITTDAPGCKETVKQGLNGFLVPVRSVSALVFAMVKFVENPDFISIMGMSSRRIAEDRFDVQKINKTMLIEMGI
jgi:glycosyltransferase involved in cell wall biosynthesis